MSKHEKWETGQVFVVIIFGILVVATACLITWAAIHNPVARLRLLGAAVSAFGLFLIWKGSGKIANALNRKHELENR